MNLRGRTLASTTLALVLAISAPVAGADTLSTAERQGQRLYQLGAADNGELAALLAQGTVRLTGAPAACARCHGSDGDGSSEAGLATPPIVWSRLGAPRSAGAGLRERPAYDETTLRRALREGIDAAGQQLSPAMPRFALTTQQESALLAYLQALGSERDLAPGVTADAVRIAIVGDGSATAESVRQAATACLRESNDRGGLFGRRLKVTAHDAAALAEPDARARLAADSALVLAPWWPDEQAFAAFAQTAQRERLAIVGPVPPTAAEMGTVFHVAPDMRDAWRVIVDHLAKRVPAAAPRRTVIAAIAPPDLADRAVVLALLREQAALHGHLQLAVADGVDADELRRWLAQRAPAAVIALGGAAQLARIDAALAAAGRPDATVIAAPFARVGRAVFSLPPRARARLALAHAHPLPGEAAPERMMQRLRAQNVPLSHPAAQATAYAAGCLAVEALARSGRRLTRERLIQAIESISRFETGVAAPLSFGPRRRHGVWGARIVSVDGEQLAATTPWLTPAAP